eukprot:m51a1_g7070 hypothetical protein (276) ;mRNA; f:199981-201228
MSEVEQAIHDAVADQAAQPAESAPADTSASPAPIDPVAAVAPALTALSGWWGSVVSSVSDTVSKTVSKTVETVNNTSLNEIVDICTKDLADFSSQIREDSQRVVSDVQAERLPTIRAEVHSFVRQLAVATGFEPVPPSEAAPQGPSPVPAAEAALESSIRRQPEDAGAFEEWRKTFDLNSMTEQVAEVLSKDETVRTLHTRLVPAEISYKQFWENYFYQQHQRQQQQEQRQAILTRVAADDEDIGWEAEEDDGEAEAPSGEEKSESKPEDKEEDQ